MFYKKNRQPALSNSLFADPTSEYRAAPFWAWNTKLDKNELLWQIEELHKMGFGGFHMHSRSGMGTEYLGGDFMDLVKACCDKAKKEEMLAYLYDEDRWPSGFAGGYVTKNPKYRRKNLLFTVTPKENTVDKQTGIETGAPYFLNAYDVVLNDDGTLKSYAKIGETDAAVGTKWYVYVCTMEKTGRFNGETYVDTLDPEAIREFIRITYEAYEKAVGNEFGKVVPSIFTDEPQFIAKQALPFAASKNDITLPYTTDLAETFFAAYGIDLLDHLPELLWDKPEGKPSRVRYLYHDHVCERFTEAFSDQCGAWCDKHGIALTGHMMAEDTLGSQTNCLGEAMRAYRSFGIPGIDVLCDSDLYATAKQCQSAVHQYAREGMISELYGVTGWDFDFRGHKYQGDWQEALGVTIRVPHLAWVSMKGSAKRDYPASISYQSSWHKEYPYIENHFARVNTALTRGKPSVKVAVLHPIESYWLHYGPQENTAAYRKELQHNFDLVTEGLLFGTIDFDYISEGLLPSQQPHAENGLLSVGAMQYAAVIVPGMETMRETTFKVLEEFAAAGGKILFMGDCPKYIDAMESDKPRALYEKSQCITFSVRSLLAALEDVREISIRNQNGELTDNLLYQLRNDGKDRYLFIAHGKKPNPIPWNTPGSASAQDITITVKGEYYPQVYDTLTGEIKPASFAHKNGNTVIRYRLYELDSLLLKLSEESAAIGVISATEPEKERVQTIDFRTGVDYTLDEPNVFVLDMARLSEDGGKTYSGRDEMLRLDMYLRRKLHYPMASGYDKQPWQIPEETITVFPLLKFEFESEVEVPCKLAYEEACEVTLNGEAVPVVKDGYFTDKAIHTMPLPALKKGKNELLVKAPIGGRVSLENYFLLGDFGVRVNGCEAVITKKPEKLAFGSVVHQGLPFYGANITYQLPLDVTRDGELVIRSDLYRGALIGARLDGKDVGRIVLSPYLLKIPDVKKGAHTLELTLFGTRQNSFGALHNCSHAKWQGPDYWYSGGVSWAYEYQLADMGILKSPFIEVYAEKEKEENA